MKVIWDYLTKDDQLYMIGQVSFSELREELERRLQEPVEEGEEKDKEEETLGDRLILIAKQLHHDFILKEVK